MTRLLAVLACLWASQAGAQGNCKPREVLVALLQSEQYRESLDWWGRHHTGQHIVELWKGADGSWTIVRTNVDGTACIMVYGQGWSDVDPVPLGEDG